MRVGLPPTSADLSEDEFEAFVQEGVKVGRRADKANRRKALRESAMVSLHSEYRRVAYLWHVQRYFLDFSPSGAAASEYADVVAPANFQGSLVQAAESFGLQDCDMINPFVAAKATS